MLKWIFVTSPENAIVCFKYMVYGVNEEKYGYAALNHLNVNDMVFFYITKCGVFIGPWRIAKRACKNPDHPAVKEWKKGFYNIIVELEKCNFMVLVRGDLVLEKLLFVTNKKGLKTGDASGGWTDHFQFSIISIRDEDYEVLINHGKPVCSELAQQSRGPACDLSKIYSILCKGP